MLSANRAVSRPPVVRSTGEWPIAENELMFTLSILVANFNLEAWGFSSHKVAQKLAKKSLYLQ